MNDRQEIEQESSVLRWGGLSGMLGGIVFILTLVVVLAGPVGMEEPADLAGWVTRFPDVFAARVVENMMYLMALILEVALFLALYRALRRTSLAPALCGSVLGILGIAVMMVGALPHVAHAPLSDLYHSSFAQFPSTMVELDRLLEPGSRRLQRTVPTEPEYVAVVWIKA
jgi:magnesium-transporting ATPase (P-type)